MAGIEIVGSGLGLVAFCGVAYWKLKDVFVSKDTCHVCRSESKEDVKRIEVKLDKLIEMHMKGEI